MSRPTPRPCQEAEKGLKTTFVVARGAAIMKTHDTAASGSNGGQANVRISRSSPLRLPVGGSGGKKHFTCAGGVRKRRKIEGKRKLRVRPGAVREAKRKTKKLGV